ncbi:MAG: endolytic transglycosylase MltG, partial [Bacteroidetes bacterium]|nr:endolytic transglycosylase MltG [Bacteroidota bacterium]
MVTKRKKYKRYKRLKWITLVLVFLLSYAGYVIFDFYGMIYNPNVNNAVVSGDYIFIPTGADFDDVVQGLVTNNIIMNRTSFEWVAKRMNYPNHIHPGRYKINPSMNNRELIELLRKGEQVPINVTINRIRFKEDIVRIVSAKLEIDSMELYALLNDEVFLRDFGFNPETVIVNFLPDTYEFKWNTSAREFFLRMNREFKEYWNEERLKKAKDLSLSPFDVITLASIVQEETLKADEKSRIAGVYLNRLKKGMKLQADPTVKFAMREFDLQRVLKEHLLYESPYNTYLFTGLPPGPIILPSKNSINASLNPEEHNYMYFCAKEDFSGYH